MTEQVRSAFDTSPATSNSDLQLLLVQMVRTLAAGASSAQDFLFLSTPRPAAPDR